MEPQQQPQSYFSTSEPTPWINSLCFFPCTDPGTFFLGCCCPCVLYGKTQDRIQSVHLGRDPLDEAEIDSCNAPCWILCAAGQFAGICAYTQHSRIRETYKIKGSWKQDIAKSFCLGPCTLMQADREVRSRAILDKNNVQNGVSTVPYDTRNQQMRYVPKDAIFGNGLGARRSSRTLPESTTIPPIVKNQQNVALGAHSFDGAGLTIELSELHAHVPGASQKSTKTVLKTSPDKSEAISVPDEKSKCINQRGQHGIVFKEPCKADNQKFSMGTHVQGKTDSEYTITHKKEHPQKRDCCSTTVNGCPDETVFVYYNSPNTPEPQKLRDCLKTRMSESMTSVDSKRERTSGNSFDSCAANEVLSFEEPSIRAMLRIESLCPTSSAGSEHKTKHDPILETKASLSKVTESIPEVYLDTRSTFETSSSHSMMVLSEPCEISSDGSEETVKSKQNSSSNPTQATYQRIEDHKAQDNVVLLHPKTRESIIMPSAPLTLEEVVEEIDVEGEWKIPHDGRCGARTVGTKFGRKMRPSFFDGTSEP